MNRDELERNRQLVHWIRSEIQSSKAGAIPFAQFMELALYHPNYGYYTAASPVLGRDGDYMTAPELGAVFGTIMAVKIANLLNSQQIPATVYEFGAGSGILTVQILSELSRLQCEIEQYVIFEISPELIRNQQTIIGSRLPEVSKKVHWGDFNTVADMQGVAIANEVLDAMPVELVQFDSGEVLRGYVVESDDGFTLEFRRVRDDEFQRRGRRMATSELQDNYVSELHWRAEAWMRQVADRLQVGSVIIADYGFPQHEYYHPDRSQGTLICHRKHHSLHDPFAYIGCQDITAHVNFTALAKVAETAGLRVNGFTTLAGFIVDIGLERLNLIDMPSVDRSSVVQQINTLTSPAEMGELFKVIELTKNIEPDRSGFEAYDHLHRL